MTVDDLRTEINKLDERELAYVIARYKTISDRKALTESGIASSTFYGWEESKREKLNGLALRLKHEIGLRVLMILEDSAEKAAHTVAKLTDSRNENIKLKASQDILDRVGGKATQPLELSGAIEVDDARESIQRKLVSISTASDEG